MIKKFCICTEFLKIKLQSFRLESKSRFLLPAWTLIIQYSPSADDPRVRLKFLSTLHDAIKLLFSTLNSKWQILKIAQQYCIYKQS